MNNINSLHDNLYWIITWCRKLMAVYTINWSNGFYNINNVANKSLFYCWYNHIIVLCTPTWCSHYFCSFVVYLPLLLRLGCGVSGASSNCCIQFVSIFGSFILYGPTSYPLSCACTIV